jgi:hypothetical protein
VDPNFIGDENRNQNVSSSGINKDAKRAEIIQSFSCTKLCNFLRYMIVMTIYALLLDSHLSACARHARWWCKFSQCLFGQLQDTSIGVFKSFFTEHWRATSSCSSSSLTMPFVSRKHVNDHEIVKGRCCVNLVSETECISFINQANGTVLLLASRCGLFHDAVSVWD